MSAGRALSFPTYTAIDSDGQIRDLEISEYLNRKIAEFEFRKKFKNSNGGP
jgi:hypothetical protein